MSRQEQLKRIRAYCVERLETVEYIPHFSAPAESGWKATIAAIDGLDEIGHAKPYIAIADAIIAAYEGQI